MEKKLLILIDAVLDNYLLKKRLKKTYKIKVVNDDNLFKHVQVLKLKLKSVIQSFYADTFEGYKFENVEVQSLHNWVFKTTKENYFDFFKNLKAEFGLYIHYSKVFCVPIKEFSIFNGYDFILSGKDHIAKYLIKDRQINVTSFMEECNYKKEDIIYYKNYILDIYDDTVVDINFYRPKGYETFSKKEKVQADFIQEIHLFNELLKNHKYYSIFTCIKFEKTFNLDDFDNSVISDRIILSYKYFGVDISGFDFKFLNEILEISYSLLRVYSYLVPSILIKKNGYDSYQDASDKQYILKEVFNTFENSNVIIIPIFENLCLSLLSCFCELNTNSNSHGYLEPVYIDNFAFFVGNNIKYRDKFFNDNFVSLDLDSHYENIIEECFFTKKDDLIFKKFHSVFNIQKPDQSKKDNLDFLMKRLVLTKTTIMEVLKKCI